MDYIRRNWNVGKSIYSYVKRLCDIICSIGGIVLLSPVMVICALMIKLDSNGPVLFKQKRTGMFGKEFTIFKFRTMASDNDIYNQSEQDKITRVGKILRKTGFDELPQLFNILLGDMSFIGPRPWITDYYLNMNDEERHRVDVLPGITGYAQVNGRNKVPIDKKISLDLEYIDDYGFLIDLKTALLTFKRETMLDGNDGSKDNIYRELDQLKKAKVLYKKNNETRK